MRAVYWNQARSLGCRDWRWCQMRLVSLIGEHAHRIEVRISGQQRMELKTRVIIIGS